MPNNRTSGYAKSILYCVILNERAKQDSSKFLSLDIFYFFFCLSGKCIINPSLWSKMDLIRSRAGWYFVIMTVNSVSFASFAVQWLYYAVYIHCRSIGLILVNAVISDWHATAFSGEGCLAWLCLDFVSFYLETWKCNRFLYILVNSFFLFYP